MTPPPTLRFDDGLTHPREVVVCNALTDSIGIDAVRSASIPTTARVQTTKDAAPSAPEAGGPNPDK